MSWDTLNSILKTALEIGILFAVINEVLYFLRNTRGFMVLAGVLIGSFALKFAAYFLHLEVISYVMDVLLGSVAVVLAVVFQPELRRTFAQLGTLWFRQGKKQREFIGELTAAVRDMARRRCGALIVVERRIHLQNLIDDAIPLDIKVNSLILESIFYPNSPLHDGAVIIRDDRILAARAILPLTRTENISRRLGTRHRAALGISEESDSITVVVSEETGTISIAHRGVLHRELAIPQLEQLLEKLIIQRDDGEFSEAMQLIEENEQQREGKLPSMMIDPDMENAPEKEIKP